MNVWEKGKMIVKVMNNIMSEMMMMMMKLKQEAVWRSLIRMNGGEKVETINVPVWLRSG